MSSNISLSFMTGVETVTGANFLLKTPGGKKILVDCGMIQGQRVEQAENRNPFGYDPASIDVLIITHAHLDHVGRIPKLVKEGFQGSIYSTPETRAIAELVLNDAVNILAMEARQDGLDPIYEPSDVARIFPLWKTVKYHEAHEISEGVSIFLKEAGHILGSSMVEMSVGGKKILFTGDLGNSPAPLLRDTETVGDVDYMVMESVYGDRNHTARETRLEQFQKVITDTLSRGGTLVIPAFSVDRTQVLLYELNNLVESKQIPSVPIFLDSPLGEKVTSIYRSSALLFNDAARAQIAGGDDIFAFPKLTFVGTQNESKGIDGIKGAKIILAGSGMSIGGRVISHEQHFLSDERSTILLVGYQTPGSLGRQLAEGAKNVTIHGTPVKVKARIETLYGYSAHKDSDHLVEFVSTASDRLKEVFVVMGEPKAAMHLAQRLNDELQVKAITPKIGQPYDIA